MTKEELKQRFEKEIGTPNDYFNHRGGLMNEVFDWFWSEIESRDNRIKELEEQVNRAKPCDHCGGSGYDSYPNNSTSYPVCPACHGNNDTMKGSRMGDYVLRLESACNEKTLTAREKVRIIKALLSEFKQKI